MQILDILNNNTATQQTDNTHGIVVYPRIHCFSLDLSKKAGFIKHGAFGFSINGLPITIKAELSSQDNIRCNIDISSIDYLIHPDKLRENLGVTDHWQISINCNSPLIRNHIGIGISTQINGGAVLACARASQVNLTINNLFQLGVGNTSTLGLKLLFHPGMILETGLSNETQPSTIVYDFADFPFFSIVAIPKQFLSISGDLENSFYDSILPDPANVSDEIAYEVFEKMIPATVEQRFEAFLGAMNNICRLGTKPVEESIQPEIVTKELARLRSLFGFAAVSSMGPTIYSFSVTNPSQALKALSTQHFEYLVFPPRRQNA
ncbi:hypothetical protein IJ101_02675 [Candidatus Saccharibacteria bacterium]|nr:hypothetical protein [Candidatus Saccharibacteria bacterium]